MYDKRFKRRKLRFLFPLLFPLMWALLAAIVMWLWNAILPSLLHTNTITFLQSAGLLLLSRILFGGFHFRKPGDRSKWGNHWGNMREKWMNMSEEERSKFKDGLRNRCRPPQKRDSNAETDKEQ